MSHMESGDMNKLKRSAWYIYMNKLKRYAWDIYIKAGVKIVRLGCRKYEDIKYILIQDLHVSVKYF